MLLAYESKLFSCDPLSPKKDDSDADDDNEDDEHLETADLTRGDGVVRKGTWQLSDIEKIVIFFANICKTYSSKCHSSENRHSDTVRRAFFLFFQSTEWK